MGAFIDISGQKFGRLTVLCRVGPSGRGFAARWKCSCDCGNSKEVCGTKLRSGNTVSCGCFRREATAEAKRTHGASGLNHKTWSPEYRAWVSMKTRCSGKYTSREDYVNYYGRGIRICDRWISSFENFLEDMGARPAAGYSVDRIDVDGHYEPGNCRWATNQEQALNRRTSLSYKLKALEVTS